MGNTFKLGNYVNAIFQDASNNIGIGAAPSGSYKLEVTGTAKVSSTLLVSGAATFSSTVTTSASTTNGFIAQTTANSVYPYFRWVANNRSYWAAAIDNGTDAPFSIGNGNTVGSSILFSLTPSNNTAYFAGSVGIGTSSPDNKLHIISDAAASTNNYALRLQNTTTVADGRVGIAFLDNSNTGSNGSGATIQVSNNGVDGTGNLLFGSLLNGTNTERMRITSGGNVGIGNAGNASYRLNVTGVDATSSNYSFVANNSAQLTFGVRNDGLIETGTAANSPYNVTATGRNAVLSSSGVLGYLVSTRESKANIESIKNIDFINQLNPVQFNYRKKDYTTNEFTDELYDNITYGFIADEVENVNKELAFYNEDGTLAGVEYNNMIAILTKAVQEQNKMITSLQDRLTKGGL